MIPEQRQLNEASLALRAIAHPVRLQLLCLLCEKPMNVTELMDATDSGQSSLSQHLAKLRMMNLLKCERRSQHVYYRLADEKLNTILDAIKSAYCPLDNREHRK